MSDGILVQDKPMTPRQAYLACIAEIKRVEDILFDSAKEPNPHMEGSWEHRGFEEHRRIFSRRVLPDGWREAAEKYLKSLREYKEQHEGVGNAY